MANDLLQYKQGAAWQATTFVQSGMVVGLGHGSTAIHAVRRIAELLHAGELHAVLGVPCSEQVAAEARALGVPLTTLDEHPVVDLTIDGADEVDPALDLVKGAGGALLREKIVAQASRREIIVVDATKLTPALGSKATLPVEVAAFGWRTHVAFLQACGAHQVELRQDGRGAPFRTDGGNLLLDCRFGAIADPYELAGRLDARAGIVGHGLFLRLASDVIVAGPDGISHLTPSRSGS